MLRLKDMNQDPLDPLLKDYARRPLPLCPDDLQARVWDEIEQRRRGPYWTKVVPLLEWRELFAEPRLAIAAFACALVVGVVPGSLAAKARAEQQLAKRSFQFGAFSSKPPQPFQAAFRPSTMPGHLSAP